jgi:feruloyl esterase
MLADQVIMTNAIVGWVEEGRAPDGFLAESSDKRGKTIRTHPLYPYPHEARYERKGSTDGAESFVSVD